MDYKVKIEVYRKKFTDKRLLLFVDFLQTLVEWLERLYELKRIPVESKDIIDESFPIEIFNRLDILPEKFTKEKFVELKKLLLGETTRFVHTIITYGRIKLHDFDLLQFNLYQIFGKEELASMVEWSRLHLREEIASRKAEEKLSEEKKIKEQKEYLSYVRSLSQPELNKRAMRILFNFAPSARSDDERMQALSRHRETINGHRQTFHKFEEKLIDATSEARKSSESNVYRRMGVVSRHMGEVAEEFRKKAAIFVSTEGPRKKIGKAKDMIGEQSLKLQEQMQSAGKKWEAQFGQKVVQSQEMLLRKKSDLESDISSKGKKWEQDFLIEVATARDKISTSTGLLSQEVGSRGKEWQKDFQEDIEKAQNVIGSERKHLMEQRNLTGMNIKSHGQKQFFKASEMISIHTTKFSSDIDVAKNKFEAKEKIFEQKRTEMGTARTDFSQKSEDAAQRFLTRGSEIESTMYGTIYKEKRRFEIARDEAQQKFIRQAKIIGGQAVGYMSRKRNEFISNQSGAAQKFVGTKQGDQATTKAVAAKGKMSLAQVRVMAEGKKRQKIMQNEMKHKRDLFQYEVRFAQHKIKLNAKEFAERIEEKQEEFVARGTQVVARHKARQKSHLIRNLLRTIRATH